MYQKTKQNQHYYYALWAHLIWATKYREPVMVKPHRFKLYDEFRNVARENGIYLDFINGVEDHLHILVCPKPKFSISDVVRILKGNTYHWAKDYDWFGPEKLHWQDGYAAISVSPDRVPGVRNYIRNQEKHHAQKSFNEEWEYFKKRSMVFHENGEIDDSE